ncbi:MAG TPA: polysaccharide deacetylase family protein [Anaeromyxobacter sp.]|nr:polysaccharide deacetylase family protein [Anaeromyxobacter sp.]
MPERADDSPRWIVRRAVKVALAGALRAAGVDRAVSRLRRAEAGGTRVLVLAYHRVVPAFADAAREALPSLVVSAETLRLQLEQVARTHDLVTLADATRILTAASAAPRDVAAVTFDDGYADNHDVALPVLAALRAPATLFVATGFTGTRRRLLHDRLFASLSELARRGIPYPRAELAAPAQSLLAACADRGPAATLDRLVARLPHRALAAVADALERRTGLHEEDLPAGTRVLGWEELRAMQAAGVELGGHSVHHAVLSNLPIEEARREIVGCRDDLAERAGRRPRHFAYPNGYHTPAVRTAVAEAGFEAALTTEDRENVRAAPPLAVCRKVLWENTTRGPLGYSASLASCCFAGVFQALRLARAVRGERADAPGTEPGAAAGSRLPGGREEPRDPFRTVAGGPSERELC